MVDEKNPSKRRISINDSGIERRRAAIQAIVDQVPPVGAGQVVPPPRLFGPDPRPAPRPAPPSLDAAEPERSGTAGGSGGR
ncbi:hypothetical protein ABGB18_14470 [Nonomuraea sp. B12E4]|uniref:hypothetical protein n=1 Tax=Nonomuraea sp. B12E4 TaxID=3153564 RepID=UPI00325C7D5C